MHSRSIPGYVYSDHPLDSAGSQCDETGAEGLLNALATCAWAPRSLDLSCNAISAHTASCLASCLQCATTSCLSVCTSVASVLSLTPMCFASPDATLSVARSRFRTNLNCALVKPCRQSAALTSLQSLNLSHTAIGDKGAAVLCGSLEDLVQLTALRVRQCRLQDQGCALVATLLRDCHHIAELDLSWNVLGPSACAAVIECLPHAQHLEVRVLPSLVHSIHSASYTAF